MFGLEHLDGPQEIASRPASTPRFEYQRLLQFLRSGSMSAGSGHQAPPTCVSVLDQEPQAIY